MKEPYTRDFFEKQQESSISSAEVVVPIVLSLFPVSSVVDVGCGVGGWLKAFERLGIDDYLGIDGDYVPRDMLKIPVNKFISCDLRTLTDVGRRFDLACSLEVAEHLPEHCAEHFVSVLVKTAPVVLFSAAIPGQGGTDHLNEQWQSYWCKIFNKHEYIAVDCIRPVVHGDSRVEVWYRQNILVFCKEHLLPECCSPVIEPYYLDRVDPEMFRLKLLWMVEWYEAQLKWYQAQLNQASPRANHESGPRLASKAKTSRPARRRHT
jgi:SAM-dependent methyltransferase